MIKKLKSKIFTLMTISLSTITIGTIVVFAVLNCNSAIRTSRYSINRMTRMRDRPDFQEPLQLEIQDYINEENEKTKVHIRNVIIFSGISSGVALVIIYAISKKVSTMIVKPVEDTIEVNCKDGVTCFKIVLTCNS